MLLILRGRYDIRGLFLALRRWALRLAGLAAGAPHGVTAAVLGLLIAQLITTASIVGVGFARAAALPAGGARAARGRPQAVHPLRASRARSTPALDAFRTWIAPLALGIVAHGDRRRPVPRRAGAAVRVRRALRAGADGPAQRADPRLGGRPARHVIAGPAPLHRRLGDADGGDPAAGRAARCRGSCRCCSATTTRPRSARRGSCSPRPRSSSSSAGRSRSRSRSAGPGLRVVAHAVEVAVLLPLILLFGELLGRDRRRRGRARLDARVRGDLGRDRAAPARARTATRARRGSADVLRGTTSAERCVARAARAARTSKRGSSSNDVRGTSTL